MYSARYINLQSQHYRDRDREIDFYELEASQVYTVNFRLAKVTQWDPASFKKKKKKLVNLFVKNSSISPKILEIQMQQLLVTSFSFFQY